MISSVSIKNFALIKDLNIEFTNNFNVLIGETGAGKSLILDAINFALGDKSNKLNIRTGENFMKVQICFFDYNNLINNLLNDYGITVDDNLIISRTLNLDGKSECRINGEIVTNSVLKNIALLLVDSYGQNEGVELLKSKNHILMLDSFNDKDILPLKENINVLLIQKHEIGLKIESLGGNSLNRERNLEILKFQIDDIKNANLTNGEDDEIKYAIDKLNNYEDIYNNLMQAKNLLKNGGVLESLYLACENLSKVTTTDSLISDFYNRLNNESIEIKDISESLSDYLVDLTFDEKELERLDKRLDEIKSIKKKYGGSIEEAIKYLEKIEKDYDELLNSEQLLEKFIKELSELELRLKAECLKLHDLRVKNAQFIETKIQNELVELGMKNAQFKVDIQTDNIVTKEGNDRIEFLFSANAGEGLKSLSKTISGGEMSRFMLALKNVLINKIGANTLIFDEIDSGISGVIASKVAQKLAMISNIYQVICITHLSQVTSMADNYIFVYKTVVNDKTETCFKYLTYEEIVQYIASIGGVVTSVAIEHAKEQKEQADKFKQNNRNN